MVQEFLIDKKVMNKHGNKLSISMKHGSVILVTEWKSIATGVLRP